ncbi:helix-turn-helix domain-containing protein (plasmid) [Novosphingobium resinovorum]|uniref:TetR/AcrR family transcriptional regulator n=1 Tax=Novosphingobium TaxID=165696 RepID=UPI001B3C99C7|nr:MULTISPECIES: TetR/AcrR family transcriptional regulator [Novosphingobium]MBF7015274.1 TetR/AcrR family transcriptional regulator [Novosphingobium sp. HR1a]WJM29950.1 helix-turn-helix domain-containing protein [Novosphingobium resinovorum]
MPKRDQKYMDGQRTAIAHAALTVLLEKGVYATSLRDICRTAGVSMGALYTHFATKEDIIVAACMLDHASADATPTLTSWEMYVAQYFGIEHIRGSRVSKRFRLSLQFVAELTQMEENPEGLSTIYHLYRGNLASGLAALEAAGIVDLPYGLEMTTEMHMQILAGAEYQIASDKTVDREMVRNALEKSLALTAGLREVTKPA